MAITGTVTPAPWPDRSAVPGEAGLMELEAVEPWIAAWGKAIGADSADDARERALQILR